MLSPIVTSSKQHVITITGKLLNSKKGFSTNNNTWTLEQPNNKQQEILQQCNKLTYKHYISEHIQGRIFYYKTNVTSQTISAVAY